MAKNVEVTLTLRLKYDASQDAKTEPEQTVEVVAETLRSETEAMTEVWIGSSRYEIEYVRVEHTASKRRSHAEETGQ